MRVWPAGSEVPADRRQRTGESCAAARIRKSGYRFNQPAAGSQNESGHPALARAGARKNDRGMVLETP